MDVTLTHETEIRITGPFVITVAHGLLLLVAIAAAVMRFSELSAIPLSAAEAQEALAVWHFWQPVGQAPAAFDAGPAYFNLTAFLVSVLGDSDAVMRLVPALFGVALTLLPWLWRNRLGTAGALVAGLLLAASPTAAIVARTAGGDAIALFAVLLLLIAWLRYQEDGGLAWLYTAVAALALGISSSPLFYSGLVTMALAWLVHARIGPVVGELPSLDGRGIDRAQLGRAALAGLATFLAVGTLLLWRPAGFGAAATLFGRWLAAFGVQGGLGPLFAPFLALGRYELIVVFLGGAAILRATWRGYPLPLFFVYWFGAALLLLVLQRGVRANVLLLVLPAYFLIALWLDDVLRRPLEPPALGLALFLLLLSGIFYFNMARYLRLATFSSGQLSHALLALIVLALAAVTVNLVATWDRDAALQGALAGLVVLFLVYNWGTAWWLTHAAANDPRGRWVDTGTDDDVRLLAATVREVSEQLTGSAIDASLLVAVDHPVLRWYLRGQEKMQIGDTVPPGSQQQLIITPADATPALGDDYFGMDLGLLQTGVVAPEGPQVASVVETLRWWFFHEAADTIQKEKIVLWVRNDALTG